VKKVCSSLLAALLLQGALVAAPQTFEQFWADAQVGETAKKSPESIQRLAWWRDGRFGMFIHWNMSSVAASEISWSKKFNDGSIEELTLNPRPSAGPAAGKNAKEIDSWKYEWMRPPMPGAVYDNLYKSFYPGMFDADKIVATAKEAGMKYIIMVAKHHDGFCMWDTALSDYKITSTPFHRDILGEMAKAADKAGMPFGIYYSQRDWHHPDYGPERMAKYNEYMAGQIRELLTRYPNISAVWFDSEGYPSSVWNTQELFRMIHGIRPGIVINDRCGIPSDWSTPEQSIGAFNRSRNWESCMTFTGFWSWHGFQTKVIPFNECILRLIRCAGGDGNLLMNVGPMPTGQIDPREEERLLRMGQWLRKYGESIYGTTGGPFKPAAWGVSTCKGNDIYLHVTGSENPVQLPPIDAKILSAVTLDGVKLTYTQDAKGIAITLPPEARTPIVTEVKLTTDREATKLAPK
jgi:alpha-L-fucosidase